MLRATSTLLIVSLAGLASTALAQGPTVTGRVFGTMQAGHPMAVPGGFSAATRFDADHVLFRAASTAYMSDGQTLRPVMVAGEQIPGQPAGVVWAARQDSRAEIWPVDGRGARFLAYATGPGLGDEPRSVEILSDLGADPVFLRPSTSVGATTRTGLTWSWQNGLAVGPVDGVSTVRIPMNYTPPGFEGRLSGLSDLRINLEGVIAAQYSTNGPASTVILAADQSSIRTVAAGNSTLATDRGNYALRSTLELGSAPMANGDVAVNGLYNDNNVARSITWISHPSGSNTLLAKHGDRVPGTEPGVTYQSVSTVAANARGSVLLSATLQGPGVTPENNSAYVLRRNGRDILVARSQPGASLYFYFFSIQPVTLTANDRVGIITRDQALIFTPEIGTVKVARLNQPLPAELGLAGNPYQFTSFFGIHTVARPASDEARIACLSEAGELAIGVNMDGGSSFIGLRVIPGCPADFNLNGFTDFFDYSDFVECFEGGRCPDGRTPDFNNDDFDDFFDYSDFVTAFETGC